MKKDSKNLIVITMITIIVIILGVLGATYAYFAASLANNTKTNVKVIANTIDGCSATAGSLVSTSIANQENFGSGMGDRIIYSEPGTLTMTSNNSYRGRCDYKVELNITSNGYVYTVNSSTPELKAQFEKSVGCTGTYEAVGSEVDITAKTGIVSLLTEETSDAPTDIGGTVQVCWRAKIRFVNLDSNQNANTGKLMTGEVIITPISTGEATDEAYVYWNDNYSGTNYNPGSLPNTTYQTRELLASNYANYSSRPEYIKSTTAAHQACLWYNNHEFCLAPGYWIGDAQDQTDGSSTKAKLKADMEAKLKTTASSCDSNFNNASCYFGSVYCHAISSGGVNCSGGGADCVVHNGGRARCIVSS